MVAALKADKKRLKAEKFDLLSQMKQLYATLEDKEKELRDFIRNYEQVSIYLPTYMHILQQEVGKSRHVDHKGTLCSYSHIDKRLLITNKTNTNTLPIMFRNKSRTRDIFFVRTIIIK